MSLRDQFKTNPDKELNGVEVTYGENKDGSVPTFILARAGKANRRYQAALQKAMRPHQRSMQLGTLAPEKADEIYRDVFISTLLMGWNNVKTGDIEDSNDNSNAPFTAENAVKLFELLPDLYDLLVEQSGTASLFRDETNEEAAKN